MIADEVHIVFRVASAIAARGLITEYRDAWECEGMLS